MEGIKDLFDISGKVAIVTGGGTGIGRSIAEGLAEAGATVVIVARRLSKCEEACHEISERTGARTMALRCDVTKPLEIESVVKKTIEILGHVDILVNNAGVGGSEKPVIEMTEGDWESVIDSNLTAVYRFSKAVAIRMIERGKGGKIINVASIGYMIAWPNMSAYCASKAGCVQLTRVMALEWARHNIQVNAILPGYFATPMNEEFFSKEVGKKVVSSYIPMKRIGHPDEIKGVAILLASRASSFMTGSIIVVDGGQTCM